MIKYNVTEIFYSLQGEGTRAGRASVFVRLAGCNLRCPFCDTEFQTNYTMTAEDIVENVLDLDAGECKWVVITGGEPLIQDCVELLAALKNADYKISLETNGTREFDYYDFNWVCISPKSRQVYAPLGRVNELKWVVTDSFTLEDTEGWVEAYPEAALYLQPESMRSSMMKKATDIALKNPQFGVSVQLHKVLEIR